MPECNDNNTPLTASNPEKLNEPSPLIDTEQKRIENTIGNTSGSLFNVDNLLSAAKTYFAINKTVNNMFGYSVKWFRAVPQQRSKDVIFQEYTLYNVEECPIDVKVVLPDGRIPDSKYTYDLMGLQYEIPLEIQIDKRYWEEKAGFGTAPQKKDIVYFPISNKLYQVESSYLSRGFMEQETTWVCNLIKYQPEAARKEGTNLQETIDIYTVSTEEIFGGAIDNEIKKLTDDKQMSQFNSTSQDKYKSIDASLSIIVNRITAYGTIIAESYYDLQTSAWYDAVIYKDSDNISKSSDRAITAWFMPRTISEIHKEYEVNTITEIVNTLDPSTLYEYDASLYTEANYTITLKTPISLNNIQIDDTVVISRPGALNFYAKVVAISINPLQFHCAINPFVLEDLNEIRTDWYNQKGYKLTVKEPICIIDGTNEFGDHVFSVNIYANQYIAISYGHTYCDTLNAYSAYVIRMDEKLNDNEWYGIVVNIGNTWNQYSAYIWKIHETDKNAKLRNIFYETLKLYPEDIAISSYTINKSPAYLTNIRLFKCTIEEEKQSNELLSYFSQNGEQLIIGDNADPKLRLPYITRQR